MTRDDTFDLYPPGAQVSIGGRHFTVTSSAHDRFLNAPSRRAFARHNRRNRCLRRGKSKDRAGRPL